MHTRAHAHMLLNLIYVRDRRAARATGLPILFESKTVGPILITAAFLLCLKAFPFSNGLEFFSSALGSLSPHCLTPPTYTSFSRPSSPPPFRGWIVQLQLDFLLSVAWQDLRKPSLWCVMCVRVCVCVRTCMHACVSVYMVVWGNTGKCGALGLCAFL